MYTLTCPELVPLKSFSLAPDIKLNPLLEIETEPPNKSKGESPYKLPPKLIQFEST